MKVAKHLGRSSAAYDQGSTNGLATLAPDLTEQEANFLVLKIMQELSDQLEQGEKQLDSTHVAAVSCSEQTQTVSLPGDTWGEHRVSDSQRQYHVSMYMAKETCVASHRGLQLCLPLMYCLGNVPIVGTSVTSRSGS